MADKREPVRAAEKIARLKQLCADLDVIRKKATEICNQATQEIRAAHTSSRQRAFANSTSRGTPKRASARKKR
jgi:hypothetical protein